MFKQFKAFEAPASYDFKDPDTGLAFNSHNKEDLIQQIVSYRSQNGLEPIDGLSLVLDNYWCSKVENAGKCNECPEEMIRGFSAYLKGGMTLLKTMLFKKFASKEVAEDRASQCVQCRYNVFPEKSPAFFQWTNNIAIECIGKRSTTKDEKLGICGVCLCPLRSKVHIGEKLDPFTPEQTRRMTEVNCWQLPLVKE